MTASQQPPMPCDPTCNGDRCTRCPLLTEEDLQALEEARQKRDEAR